MTIALGFKCEDGIALASDSQYSAGLSKTRGQKIFVIPSNGHYALMVAGAGSVANMKRAVELLEGGIRDIGDRAATTEELRGKIEAAITSVYLNQVYPVPSDVRDRLEFQLLVAIWTAVEGNKLFNTSDVTVTEAPDRVCIDIGAYLGDYLTDLLCRPSSISVEEAGILAAYLIRAVKDHVQHCGGDTFVRVLGKDGTDGRLGQDEIQDAEGYFEALFNALRGFLICLNVAGFPDVGDQEIAIFTDLFAADIKSFREKQNRRKLEEERRRQRAEELKRMRS